MRALLLMLAINPILSEDPVTEIALERTPCFGTCPVDRVVLRSDGTASYIGTRHVKLRGTYLGKVGRGDFDELARLVVDKGFFALEDRYEAPITCLPSRITTVRRGDGTKSVRDYGKAGPDRLRDVEDRIIELMGKIEWKRDPSAPQPADTDCRESAPGS